MEQEIIKKYQEGKSISQLLIEYPNLNRRQMTKLLKDNNIVVRGGRKKKLLTPEQIETIKQMIEDGAFLKDLAEYCNLDQETMKLRMSELNITFNNNNRVNRRIDSNYFSKIDSPIKAYWLGFLYTDGSVDHYRKTGRIRLQLQERDIEILEKFKEDLRLDSKIIYDIRENSTCCSVEFVDEQIFNDLAKYAIVPNKTYEINYLPYNLIPEEYLNSYALGLFDGDGCLTNTKGKYSDIAFRYCAYHESEVLDFQKLINLLIGKETNTKPYYNGVWNIQWRGRSQVINILNTLYKNNPRFLQRKHDKYIELLKSLE